MKKIVFLIAIFLLLSSCGEEDGVAISEKKDFYIETISLGEYSQTGSIEKTGRISGSQEILLSSQASGQVADILVKQGELVEKGQVLAYISDSIASYGISLQRSALGIDRAKINYDANKLSLDKQVFDAEQNLESLERSLRLAQEDAEKNLALAQDTRENSNYDGLESTAALQLQQLDNNIEKSYLDYEIKLASDAQQIETFKNNILKDFSTSRNIIVDVVSFGDELLGVTPERKRDNDDFEDLLGVQDSNQKNETRIELLELIDLQNSDAYTEYIGLLGSDISQEKAVEIGEFQFEMYELMTSLLVNLEIMLNNSAISIGSLNQAELDAFIATTNGYQTQVQSLYTGFLSLQSSYETFFATYEKNQDSILKSIQLQEREREITLKQLQSSQLSADISYDRTELSLEDNIENLEQQIEIAKNTLENAKKNREITLRSLENAISDAQVSYSASAKEYAKLSITAPISGVVGDILIDEGQDISTGTQAFEILSNGIPEVEVSLSKYEKNLIQVGTQVEIEMLDGTIVSGEIYSVSQAADQNLNYSVLILFESSQDDLGSLVDVRIPIFTPHFVLPLNALRVSDEASIAYVQHYNGEEIDSVRVRMGEIRGDSVEIVSCALDCNTLNIVLTDMTNYDSNNFNLKTAQ